MAPFVRCVPYSYPTTGAELMNRAHLAELAEEHLTGVGVGGIDAVAAPEAVTSCRRSQPGITSGIVGHLAFHR